MIIPKTKLHNELREMRATKCEMVFHLFTRNSSIFFSLSISRQFSAKLPLLSIILLVIWFSAIVIIVVVAWWIIFLRRFLPFTKHFRRFVNGERALLFCVICPLSYPFCTVCLILNFRFIRLLLTAILPKMPWYWRNISDTSVAYLEMSITPLITIDLAGCFFFFLGFVSLLHSFFFLSVHTKKKLFE